MLLNQAANNINVLGKKSNLEGQVSMAIEGLILDSASRTLVYKS